MTSFLGPLDFSPAVGQLDNETVDTISTLRPDPAGMPLDNALSDG